MTTPDHVVVQDQSLIQDFGVTQGLKPGGWILLNCALPPSDMSVFANYRVAIADATSIALKNRIGSRTHPIVNTAMIGAFARMMEEPPMDTVIAVIRKEVPSDPDGNVALPKRPIVKSVSCKKNNGGRGMKAVTSQKPFVAITYETTESNRTGSWRFLKPRYQDKTSPCSAGLSGGRRYRRD